MEFPWQVVGLVGLNCQGGVGWQLTTPAHWSRGAIPRSQPPYRHKDTENQYPNHNGSPPEAPTKFAPPAALPRKLVQLPAATPKPSKSPIGDKLRSIIVEVPIPQATKTQREEFKRVKVKPINTTADLINYLINKTTKQTKPSSYYNPFKLTKNSEPKSFKQILRHPLKDQ